MTQIEQDLMDLIEKYNIEKVEMEGESFFVTVEGSLASYLQIFSVFIQLVNDEISCGKLKHYEVSAFMLAVSELYQSVQRGEE